MASGPGIFGMLTGAMGEGDPAEAMGQYADEMQRRNRAALGLDANGNPLPQGQQPPPGQSVAQAQAASTLPPGQEPNATKTPESMGHMIMDLARYDQRQQGFNQALGAGFAAMSQPRDRGWVSSMFNVQPIDASKYGQTLMNVGSQQQGQDRANAVNRMVNDPTIGPQIAQAFGMDWGALKAGVLADPGLVTKIAETWGTADERVRAGTQVGHGALGGAGGGPSGTGPISDIGKQIVADVGGDANAAMNQAQMAWDQKHTGQPTPWNRNDVESFKLYTADQADRQKTAQDAQITHGHNIYQAIDMTNRIDEIRNSPALDEILRMTGPSKTWAKSVVLDSSNTPTSQLAQSLPPGVSFTSAQLRVLDNIRQLQGQTYGQALHALGLSRPSEREIEGIKAGLGQTANLDLAPDDYKEQGLDQTNELVKTMVGNSFGASQNLKDIPDRFRPYVDNQFLPGGTKNIEGSGAEPWFGGTKPNANEIARAKKAIADGIPRWKVDMLMHSRGMRAEGY